jgi:hypothetical protein
MVLKKRKVWRQEVGAKVSRRIEAVVFMALLTNGVTLKLFLGQGRSANSSGSYREPLDEATHGGKQK